MWTCQQCGKEISDSIDVCLDCATARDNTVDLDFQQQSASDALPRRSAQSPTTKRQAVRESPTAARVFGVLNLIAVVEAATLGLFTLPASEAYCRCEISSSTGLSTPRTLLKWDVLFLIELNVRLAGLVVLLASAVGLLLRKRWGRTLSLGYGWSVLLYYVVFWGLGRIFLLHQPGQWALACIYPIALLIGMYRPNIIAALRPRAGARDVAPAKPETAGKPNCSVAPDQPRSPFRLTLRKLLIVVVALAVVFAEIGWWINNPLQREVLKLKYGNYSIRNPETLAVMVARSKDPYPVLVQTLKYVDRAGRGRAQFAWGLNTMGSRAVPVLLTAIDHQDIGVRVSAVHSLLYLGQVEREPVKFGPAHVPVLVESLEHAKGADERRRVARAFAGLRPDGTMALILALRHDDGKTAAAAELERNNFRMIIDRSEEYWQDPERVQSVVGVLFNAFKYRDRSAGFDHVRRAAILILRDIYMDERVRSDPRLVEAAVPVLIEALRDRDWLARDCAAFVLGRIGAEAREAIPALVQALEDDNRLVRVRAADALGRIGWHERDRLVLVLIKALKDGLNDKPGFFNCAPYAARALREFGSDASEAVPALIEALQGENVNTRNAAIEALKKIDPKAVAEARLK